MTAICGNRLYVDCKPWLPITEVIKTILNGALKTWLPDKQPGILGLERTTTTVLSLCVINFALFCLATNTSCVIVFLFDCV